MRQITHQLNDVLAKNGFDFKVEKFNEIQVAWMKHSVIREQHGNSYFESRT